MGFRNLELGLGEIVSLLFRNVTLLLSESIINRCIEGLSWVLRENPMVLPFRIQVKPLTVKFVVLKPIHKVFQIILTCFLQLQKQLNAKLMWRWRHAFSRFCLRLREMNSFILLDLIGHILHETHHGFVKQVLKKDVNFFYWQ